MIGDFADNFDNDTCGVGDALTGIGGIGENNFNEGKRSARGFEQWHGPVAVLNRGGVQLRDEKPAIRVDQRMTFAALDLLPASKPLGPPLSVVFTD